jgi:hypothetical protein
MWMSQIYVCRLRSASLGMTDEMNQGCTEYLHEDMTEIQELDAWNIHYQIHIYLKYCTSHAPQSKMVNQLR